MDAPNHICSSIFSQVVYGYKDSVLLFRFLQNQMILWPLISNFSVQQDFRMLEVDFRRASVLTLLILYRFFNRRGWMEFWKDKMNKNLSKVRSKLE